MDKILEKEKSGFDKLSKKLRPGVSWDDPIEIDWDSPEIQKSMEKARKAQIEILEMKKVDETTLRAVVNL